MTLRFVRISFVFLFLASIAACFVFLARNGPAALLGPSQVDRLYDILEDGLGSLEAYKDFANLGGSIERAFGACQIYSRELPGRSAGLRYSLVPVPFPFARNLLVGDRRKIRCAFPDIFDPIFIQPLENSVFKIGRRFNEAGIISIEKGAISILSSRLISTLRFSTFDLQVQSKDNSEFWLKVMPSSFHISLRKGNLDVIMKNRVGAKEAAVPIQFEFGKNTSLSERGNLISDGRPMTLLPSGFEATPSSVGVSNTTESVNLDIAPPVK